MFYVILNMLQFHGRNGISKRGTTNEIAQNLEILPKTKGSYNEDVND